MANIPCPWTHKSPSDWFQTPLRIIPDHASNARAYTFNYFKILKCLLLKFLTFKSDPTWSFVTNSWRIVFGVLWKPMQLSLKISTQRHSLWLCCVCIKYYQFQYHEKHQFLIPPCFPCSPETEWTPSLLSAQAALLQYRLSCASIWRFDGQPAQSDCYTLVNYSFIYCQLNWKLKTRKILSGL